MSLVGPSRKDRSNCFIAFRISPQKIQYAAPDCASPTPVHVPSLPTDMQTLRSRSSDSIIILSKHCMQMQRRKTDTIATKM